MKQVIQTQTQREINTQQKIVDKGQELAKLGYVRQTSNPNIFIVRSQSDKKAWYRVFVDSEFNDGSGKISCECKYNTITQNYCKHIMATCFFMGSNNQK